MRSHSHSWLLLVSHLALASATACDSTATPRAAVPAVAHGDSALDRAVHDVCDKRVVLLGEDANHGGGATLATKTTLALRLIDECHFSAVIFEASLPEFMSFNRALAARHGSPEHLADAIGGLWSVAGESDPLVAGLFERATQKRVVLGGLDGAFTATALYMQTEMLDEVTGSIAEPRRATCRAELVHYMNSDYESDAASVGGMTRTRECLAEVATSNAELVEIVASVRDSLDASAAAMAGSEKDSFNLRDKAMYDALRWHRARLPQDAKVIVWSATVHAAKSASPVAAGAGIVPMGSYVHREFGADAAVIGFSALTGTVGRPKQPPLELAPPQSGSLEARALAEASAADVAYLGPAELARTGRGTARALDLRKFTDAPWPELLDGLVVLRAEHPLNFAHEIKPRRAASP